jgi:hypothetical protein
VFGSRIILHNAANVHIPIKVHRDAGKGGRRGCPPCPLKVRGAKVSLDKNANPKNMRYND